MNTIQHKNISLLSHLLASDPDPNNHQLVRPSGQPPVQTTRQSYLFPTLPGNINRFTNSLAQIEQVYTNQNQVTYLDNDDFKEGTYRIKTPGIYRLTEDIILEPNDGHECFPTLTQQETFPSRPGPFILGFFAGITIETKNVILDLNGFTIKQSIRFYLLQRFFSTIELANSPFIPKNDKTTQGPANFGLKFVPAENVLIKNGILGLTSHHGIHGNAAKNIMIENIKIQDFEVGGIALNGVDNVLVRNVSCQNSMGTSLMVPVNGRFSAAVYLWRTLSLIVNAEMPDYGINIGNQSLNVYEAYQTLNGYIKETVKQVVRQNIHHVPKFPDPIYRLFGNPKGLQDCSAIYGILINKNGIAVNDFGACDPECKEVISAKNILISNCTISNLVLEPREVVALLHEDGSFQKDFSGSMIMAVEKNWFLTKNQNQTRFNPELTFVKNREFDFILATQVLLFKYATEKKIKWAKGVATISDNVVDWVMMGNKPLKDFPIIKTARNTDIMGHVMKGAIGIRLDFVNGASLQNNHVKGLTNLSPPGIANDILQGYLDSDTPDNLETNYHHLGNPKSKDIDIGYSGDYVRGISCTKTNQVLINNHLIEDLISNHGSGFGIDFLYGNVNCQVNGVTIRNITASLQENYIKNTLKFSLPNWIPRAIGILVRFNNQGCKAKDNNVSKIRSLIISNAIVIEAGGENLGYQVENQLGYNTESYLIAPGVIDVRPTI